MKQTLKAVGVTHFKGNIEGRDYDHTKIRVLMPVATSQTNQRGYDVLDLPFGTSENFAKLQGLKFPIDLDCDIELTTKGMEVSTAAPVAAATLKTASAG